MGRLPKWIIGFGLLLVALDVAERWSGTDLGIKRSSILCGWIGALLLIAAGLSSGQRRGSLRRGGLVVATLLTLIIISIFTWEASLIWRSYAAGSTTLITAWMLSGLALASVGLLWAIVRLRPREGIASRGYMVHIAPARPKGTVEPEPLRQSKAG